MDKKDRRAEVRTKHGLKQVMRTEWIIFPIAFLLLLGTQSCSPRIIEHYQTLRDTTYITQFARDSIFERDSIYVLEKADTVYQYVEKWRTKYIERRDTLYQSVRDTTYVTQTVEVPAPRTWWDKTKTYLLIASALALVWAYRKQIVKLIKLIF